MCCHAPPPPPPWGGDGVLPYPIYGYIGTCIGTSVPWVYEGWSRCLEELFMWRTGDRPGPSLGLVRYSVLELSAKMFHTNLQSTVWKRHVGAHLHGHQHGGRKSMKTSGINFCRLTFGSHARVICERSENLVFLVASPLA